MTLPAGTVSLFAVVMFPTVRLAAVIAASASACGCPTTSGTVTITGPRDTIRSTLELMNTFVPATGFWLMTLPAGTIALFAVVMFPTVRLAAVIAASASAWVCPTTSGTDITGLAVMVTKSGPLLRKPSFTTSCISYVPGSSATKEGVGDAGSERVAVLPTGMYVMIH